MENQITPPKSKSNFWRNTALVLISIAIVVYGFVYALTSTANSFAEEQKHLNKELEYNAACTFKRDSLTRELNHVHKYKILTDATLMRDKAAMALPHQSGDIVFLKSDSSKVVITGIVITGNRYTYSVCYSVEYRDGKIKNINPDLIY